MFISCSCSVSALQWFFSRLQTEFGPPRGSSHVGTYWNHSTCMGYASLVHGGGQEQKRVARTCSDSYILWTGHTVTFTHICLSVLHKRLKNLFFSCVSLCWYLQFKFHTPDSSSSFSIPHFIFPCPRENTGSQ